MKTEPLAPRKKHSLDIWGAMIITLVLYTIAGWLLLQVLG